jgi:hypothetical protein
MSDLENGAHSQSSIVGIGSGARCDFRDMLISIDGLNLERRIFDKIVYAICSSDIPR